MDRSRHRGHGSDRRWPPGLVACADERLVELVLAGDDVAFELLFDRHVADALWFAREALGSWGEAEEAVRHSFAAARAYLAARDREIEFGPWLQTILGNHCLSMLQARGPRPAEEPAAAVVDLDEWRRRRRMGALAPLIPGAALRDSVMSAFGVGTGAATATTAGSSLLGGTLAKLAVVAVLAGGAGITGQAVSQQGGSPAAEAHIERRAELGGERSFGAATARSTDDARRALDPAAHKRRSASGDPDRRFKPRSQQPAPVETPPSGSQTAEGPSAPAAPSPVQPVGGSGGAPQDAASATEATTTATSPVRSALQGVTDAIGEGKPAADRVLPEAALPDRGSLSTIGDDLGVTTQKLTTDVRALLSRGTTAPAP